MRYRSYLDGNEDTECKRNAVSTFPGALLQEIEEIHGNLIHKMNPILAGHIVLGARIREIIHLDIVLDTFADEAETVLPDYGIVDGALANQELAFEIFGLVDKGGFGEAFRIGLRGIHVTFSVHYLVPLPIDDRTAGDSNFESIGIIGDQ